MRKNIRVIIIIAVLISASLFGTYWIQQYLQNSRASAAPPTASFVIAGSKVKPGDSFDLTVQINPNLTPFFAFDVAFVYDPAKVSLKNTDPATILSNITPLSTKGNGVVDVNLLTGAGSTSIDTTSHTIHITAIRATGAGDPFMGRDSFKMVKISFVMNQGQSLPLNFNWAEGGSAFEKINLNYTGEEPTATPGPTGIPPADVLTSTPIPGVIQPTLAFNLLTPVPTIMGGRGQEGSTTEITERDDLLYINSIASYQSPFRYEQPIKLEKGTYTLLINAKVYVQRGRGMVIALICNETSCGAKKKNEVLYVSPSFPVKSVFSQLQDTVAITDDADNKQLILRVFCEDGSECEIDTISLEDAWGSERIANPDFAEVQKISNSRKQPSSWEFDATANLYGSVDPAFGKNGALMINNSIK